MFTLMMHMRKIADIFGEIWRTLLVKACPKLMVLCKRVAPSVIVRACSVVVVVVVVAAAAAALSRAEPHQSMTLSCTIFTLEVFFSRKLLPRQIIVHLLDVAKRQQHFSAFCLCAFQCLLLLLLLSSSSHLSSKNSSFTTGLASLSSLSTPSTTCCYFLFYFNKFLLPLQLRCTTN
ncbi:hypothetical protein TSPI_00327 [Trichinella spiralis]|uniref:Uncharacterized protein n=1 Tax=Trichinella spiralis TaxID=6334 RepID=A0ABR3KSG7_TRISP